MKDIVFLRAWYSIEPKKLYNPVTSLLSSDKSDWKGMRLTGQIRRDESIRTPSDPNSAYRVSPLHPLSPRLPASTHADLQPIDRAVRKFNPLRVPRKLEASLPFASKTKAIPAQKKATYLQKRAVVLAPEEKKAVALLQQIQALKKDKVARRKSKHEEKRVEHRKEMAKVEERKGGKIKEERRERLKKEGMKRKHEENGGGVKRRKRA